MVVVERFSSVLEIAFALNLLLYMFEIRPLLNENQRTMLGKLSEAEKRYGRVFNASWIGEDGRSAHRFLLVYSIFASILPLALLVVSGFDPSFELSILLMVVVLVLTIPMTTVFAIVHWRARQKVQAGTLQFVIENWAAAQAWRDEFEKRLPKD